MYRPRVGFSTLLRVGVVKTAPPEGCAVASASVSVPSCGSVSLRHGIKARMKNLGYSFSTLLRVGVVKTAFQFRDGLLHDTVSVPSCGSVSLRLTGPLSRVYQNRRFQYPLAGRCR